MWRVDNEKTGPLARAQNIAHNACFLSAPFSPAPVGTKVRVRSHAASIPLPRGEARARGGRERARQHRKARLHAVQSWETPPVALECLRLGVVTPCVLSACD